MTPREKIAAIFAKARSTTSPHERDNAVTLGTRLAEKAGLSLDLFDVPGRVRATASKPPPSRYSDDLFRKPSAPPRYTAEEAKDAFERYAEQVRSAAFRNVYERTAADAAAFHAAHERSANYARERAAEARAKARRVKIDEAVATLTRAGANCYPNDLAREEWAVEVKEGIAYVSADELLALARIAREKLETAGAKACPICRSMARESRFGAPCYQCSPMDWRR